MVTPLEELRFNLREDNSPYFTEDELQQLLDKNNGNVRAASYEGLMLKAEDDSISLPGGLTLKSNRSYWLRLARKYRINQSGNTNRGDAP